MGPFMELSLYPAICTEPHGSTQQQKLARQDAERPIRSALHRCIGLAYEPHIAPVPAKADTGLFPVLVWESMKTTFMANLVVTTGLITIPL